MVYYIAMHTGAGLPFISWEWVSLEWPIRILVKTASSRRFTHCIWQWSSKSGTVSLRLFFSILFHCSFQAAFTYCVDLGSQSKAGTMEFEIGECLLPHSLWCWHGLGPSKIYIMHNSRGIFHRQTYTDSLVEESWRISILTNHQAQKS